MKCEGQILPVMIIISYLDHDTPLLHGLRCGHRRRPREQRAQRCACIIFLFFPLFTDADVAVRQTGRGCSLSYVLSTQMRPLLSHFDLLITTPAIHLHFDTGWWGDLLPPRRLPPF